MNPHLTISQKRYLAASQVFHWASRDHFTMWFTGSTKRSKRTEVITARLVKKGLLVAVKHGKKLVYACPRKVRHPGFISEIEHGLMCTEGLIRFYWSNMNVEIIEERFFYGCGSIPEWGLRYPSGKMLLFEYCTADNFSRMGVMRNKLTAYRYNLENINNKFNSLSRILFVCDTTPDKLRSFVDKVKPTGLPVLFTDLNTFTQVPIGHQLDSSIYLWEQDGKLYPLV